MWPRVHEAGYICSILFIIPGFPFITSGIDLAKLDLRSGLERLTYSIIIVLVATMSAWIMALLLHLQPLSFADMHIECMGTSYIPDNYQLLWCIRIFPDVQQFCFNGMHGCNDWCCRKYTPSGARRPLWNSCRCGCISWGTDSRTACILYKAESWISKDFTYSSFHRYYGSGTLLISCNL